MKKARPSYRILSLLLLAASSGPLTAADAPATKPATLKIGDPAPSLQTGAWVQGEPVKSFAKDKTYIVEFWATWCGPCRVSIPHLNEIHKKFADKGLVVIGQDVWENDESLVAPFVKKMGDKMTYRVALDDKSSDKMGAMAKTWMQAAQANGIPTAFIVDTKGKIAWIGHPMELKDKTIEDILGGHYDVAKAAAEREEEQRKNQALSDSYMGFQKALEDKDWTAASTRFEQFKKLLPGGRQNGFAFFEYLILNGKKESAKARELAEDLLARKDAEPMQLNDFAWQILTHPALDNRDAETAEKLALRACKATQDSEPAILDTLARAQFVGKKRDAAIASQQKAISLLKADSEEIKRYQSVLESYKAGKLPGLE